MIYLGFFFLSFTRSTFWSTFFGAQEISAWNSRRFRDLQSLRLLARPLDWGSTKLLSVKHHRFRGPKSGPSLQRCLIVLRQAQVYKSTDCFKAKAAMTRRCPLSVRMSPTRCSRQGRCFPNDPPARATSSMESTTRLASRAVFECPGTTGQAEVGVTRLDLWDSKFPAARRAGSSPAPGTI